jgi:transposase
MGMAYDDNRAKLLMTLPGVAHGVAITLLGALGDIHRFKDGDHAASYLGLTPRLHQSGSKSHFGRITKAGCPQTRATLVQAVQAASDHPGPIGAFFRRLRKRKKYNVAIIATARKMVTIAYLMLKNNEPYRYAKMDVVQKKLAKCRSFGQQQADGPAATKSQVASSPLNELYQRHGLSPCQSPTAWSDGERKALTAAEVMEFAESSHGAVSKEHKSSAQKIIKKKNTST